MSTSDPYEARNPARFLPGILDAVCVHSVKREVVFVAAAAIEADRVLSAFPRVRCARGQREESVQFLPFSGIDPSPTSVYYRPLVFRSNCSFVKK